MFNNEKKQVITTSSRQTVETSRNVQTSTRTYNYTVTTSGNPSSSELFAFVSNHHDEVTTNGQSNQFPSTTTSNTTRQLKPSSTHVSLPTTVQKQPKPILPKPDPKPSVFKRLFTSFSKENFTQFQKESLRSHNEFRGKHGVADLKLCPDLCHFAQEWANKIASEDAMRHRQNNKYGENIYWASGGSVDGTIPTAAWYSEIKDYNFSSGSFSSATGHFTQVVWRGSTEMGVGIANSRNGGIYVVANYDPPGNFAGQYTANVPRPIR